LALKELQQQLYDKLDLLEHTVGIIMCHADYLESGVVKHISLHLPFDIAGVTTSSQATNGYAGELFLTIFVMTSDDVWFKTGVTNECKDDISSPVRAAYDLIDAQTSESPKLALIFLPLLASHAGDAYIDAWEQVLPKVPLFGTVATDDTLTFDDNATIYNGEHYSAAMPFVLCYGNINPRFIMGVLPQDNMLPYKGEVTKSDGPYVSEINNSNAYEYFESIGFAKEGALAENPLFVPFMVDQKQRNDYDGIPVMRRHVAFTKEGTGVFRGNIDEGSFLTMLMSDSEDVLSVTKEKIAEVNEMKEVNGALLFPCTARRLMTMRISPLVELETVRDSIDPSIPFMIGYSGGEICPTSVIDSTPVNRFHNYSLAILVV